MMIYVFLEYIDAILSRKAAFIILIPFMKHKEITFLFYFPRKAAGKSELEPKS